MTTAKFITLLLENVAASLTRVKALEYTNIAQNELLGTNHPVTRVQPDPYFETLDDIYTYTANERIRTADVPRVPGALVGDVRSISRIYAFLPGGCGVWGYWGGGNWFGAWDCNVRPEQVQYGMGEWTLDARWAVVQSSEPLENDCLVKWQKPNNPGVTTTRWYAETYLWPRQLLSERVPLTVPADFQRTLLMEHVIAIIEKRAYGRDDYTRAAVDEDMKRFRDKYANTQVQELVGQVPFKEVG